MAAFLTFILSTGFLITLHELCHFWVARRLGVPVDTFCVGFGRSILEGVSRKSGLKYKICLIPLGGYVKFTNPAESSRPETCFENRNIPTRFLILIAGPLGNFIVGAMLLTLFLWVWGQSGLVPVVKLVEPGSPAMAVGLQTGDMIISVDGVPTPTINKVVFQLNDHLGQSGIINLNVSNKKGERSVSIEVNRWLANERNPDYLNSLGMGLGYKIPPVIQKVVPGGSADRAGIHADDTVTAVKGENVDDWAQVQRAIAASGDKTIPIRVKRGNEEMELEVVPEMRTHGSAVKPVIGVEHKPYIPSAEYIWNSHYTIIQASVLGIEYAIKQAWSITSTIGKLASGQLSGAHVSGAIGMAAASGEAIERGVGAYIGYVAVVSLGLAVFNLLPLPMLDGGQIIFLVVERVRGRPLSQKAHKVVGVVGLILLTAIFCLGMYNDIFLSH